MAKIEVFDIQDVENALYAAVGAAFFGSDDTEDDLLFAGIDCRKDPRAAFFFNEKTKLFFEENFKERKEMVKLLGEMLMTAAPRQGKLTKLFGDDKPSTLDVCYQLKLTQKEKKALGKDLYLKFALIPKELILDDFGKEAGVKDDDYYLIIDFHD